jgi:dTDP-glucose pyrophosphorylase
LFLESKLQVSQEIRFLLVDDLVKKIQLVIPMAGLGTRFSKAGYTVPKPLLPIHGVPMYKVVMANLMHDSIFSLTIICPKEWGLGDEMRELSGPLGVPVNVVEIDYVTQGPAQTVSLSEPFLDPNLPVVTANSDQYIDADLDDFYNSISSPGISGAILCMEDSDPKWSYVKLSSEGFVSEVREKEVISNLATVGIYGFKSARLMLDSFKQMVYSHDVAFGEFYVAPSYRYVIQLGHAVSAINLGPVGEVMHGLGIPVDYEEFLLKAVSKKAASMAKD